MDRYLLNSWNRRSTLSQEEKVNSKNDVPIRLPIERWFHITEEHSEMAGYYFDVLEIIQEPAEIYEGGAEELLAVKEINPGLMKI